MSRARRAAPSQKRQGWFGPPLGPREYWICAALIVAALAVFGAVVNNEFIGLDDDPYLATNPTVQRGLTVDGFIFAFTSVSPFYWHPLTWLSHMAVCQFFGINPAPHHLVNLFIHAANGVLLFLLLRRLTGAVWKSATVAALFLVHPLRVESVAWVAERKDVLCVLFSLLTILAYAHYVEEPKSRKRYAAVLLLFLAALMSKPMVMPLPGILLVLDFWPLGRWRQAPAGESWAASAWPLVREKLPMFVLAAIVGAITVIGQREFIGSVAAKPLSMIDRLMNVPLTYLFYLAKTVWPHPLGLYYAYERIPAWAGLLCWAVVVGISALALRSAARAPWFIAGWAWWTLALLPTIWIADRWDRFTYFPSIGLLLAVVWGAAKIFESRKWPPAVAAGTAGAVLIVFCVLAYRQTLLWHDRMTLYSHAVEVYDGNMYSQNNLGRLLLDRGEVAESLPHLEKAVSINPNHAVARKNLGDAYALLGRYEEARTQFTAAVLASRRYADANFDLGAADRNLGRVAEAKEAFERALQLGLTPNLASRARIELGAILWQENRRDAALDQFGAAVKLDPGFLTARKTYASALEEAGRNKEAIQQLYAALSIAPGDRDARESLERLRLRE